MHASPADLIIGFAMWGVPVAILLAMWHADWRRRPQPQGEGSEEDASS